MMWIEVGNDIVNADHVVLVERQGAQVTVHLALPIPMVPPGMMYPANSSPPIGTGHVVKVYPSQQWDEACKDGRMRAARAQ